MRRSRAARSCCDGPELVVGVVVAVDARHHQTPAGLATGPPLHARRRRGLRRGAARAPPRPRRPHPSGTAARGRHLARPVRAGARQPGRASAGPGPRRRSDGLRRRGRRRSGRCRHRARRPGPAAAMARTLPPCDGRERRRRVWRRSGRRSGRRRWTDDGGGVDERGVADVSRRAGGASAARTPRATASRGRGGPPASPAASPRQRTLRSSRPVD